MNAESTADFNGAQSSVKTETTKPAVLITPRQHDTPVVLNRAQRRQLAKHIRHKAAPVRRVMRQAKSVMVCQRCGNLVILSAQTLFALSTEQRIGRCQCKATLERKRDVR
jgi:hypothetical protein